MLKNIVSQGNIINIKTLTKVNETKLLQNKKENRYVISLRDIAYQVIQKYDKKQNIV